MELVIILVLSCLTIILALIASLFAAIIPYLFFRIKKSEENIESLDETLSSYFASIGLDNPSANSRTNRGIQKGTGNAMNSVADEPSNGQPLKRPKMGNWS